MLYIVIEQHRYGKEPEWYSTNLPEAIFDRHYLAVDYIKDKAKGHDIVREDRCSDGWYMLDFVVHHDTFSSEHDELVRYQIPGITWELNRSR